MVQPKQAVEVPHTLLDTNVLSGDFDEESDPGNQNAIRSDVGKVSYITNGTWVAYKNFDFSLGATYFWIEATSGGADATIELRTGSETGPLIGTVSIPNTGGNENFRQFGTAVSPSNTGLKDVYFRFVGGGGYLLDTRSFSFPRILPGLKQVGRLFSSGNFDAESAPLDPNTIRSDSGKVGYIKDNIWVAYNGFNFGTDANFFSIEGASPGAGGSVELRLDSGRCRVSRFYDDRHFADRSARPLRIRRRGTRGTPARRGNAVAAANKLRPGSNSVVPVKNSVARPLFQAGWSAARESGRAGKGQTEECLTRLRDARWHRRILVLFVCREEGASGAHEVDEVCVESRNLRASGSVGRIAAGV